VKPFPLIAILLLAAAHAPALGETPIDTNDLDRRDGFRKLRLPASPQREGDPKRGYEYLVAGDYVKGGIPLRYAQAASILRASNALGRDGDNATLPADMTAVTAHNGVRVAAPNCMSCHAQRINGQFVLGLGNATLDMTIDGGEFARALDRMLIEQHGAESPERAAFEAFRRVTKVIGPQIRTPVRGVNSANKLAYVLAAHRDPVTLQWSDRPLSPLPPAREVVVSDVPPWWHVKKKHALFYSGLGRGDFARIIMASSLLTLRDADEAKQIDERFVDVLAYLRTIEPPPYPKPIDIKLARRGREIFQRRCAKCHGTYGADETYPNLLIGLDEIGTDPALAESAVRTYRPQIDRYNQSWFTSGKHGAKLVPRLSYVAPPLDGVWATAPYLHNGSVPTLEALLNSPRRPMRWRRSFDTSDYDFDRVGWRYAEAPRGGSPLIYDTTRPGLGNQGHTYGDTLSDDDRAALIEYLKSL